MFKRVDKRRRKKEEEEKLDLDEEVKEILGFQDTDSDESESDSDEGEEEEEEEEEGSAVDDHEEMNFGEEDEDDDEEEEEDPSITVDQALKDPLYIISVLPDIKGCIVCPDKILKGTKMIQLHRTSNAHIRRFKRFSDDSANAKPNDNAWDILKRNSKAKPKISLTTTSSGISKRAEKKKKAIEVRKARREQAKVKAKAKKAKATSESTSPDTPPGLMKPKSPPKKKRKIDMEQVVPSAKISTLSNPPPVTKRRSKESANTKPASAAAGALKDDDNVHEPPNIQDSVKIHDIVKFASNRAKTARSRALRMSKNASRPTKSAVA